MTYASQAGRALLLFTLAAAATLSSACTTVVERVPAPAAAATPETTETPEDAPPATSDAGTEPTSCEGTLQGNPRTPKPAHGRQRESCTAKELAALLDPALDVAGARAKMSAECSDCLLSDMADDTWGAAVAVDANRISFNLSACLRARGQTAKCANGVHSYELCTIDMCTSCTTDAATKACLQSATDGQCMDWLKANNPECSPSIEDDLSFCNGDAFLDFMCGGKVDPLGCSTLTQLGADVTGVAGVTPPTFTGGTIASGTYVLTKLEGFGQLGALAVGRVGRTTLAVTPTKMEEITLDVATSKVATASSTLTIAGSTMTVARTCPETQTMNQRFTATPTSLVLGLGFTNDAADGIVATYTKR